MPPLIDMPSIVVDAGGFDELARIASFAAIGFSLIGVGWL